MRTQRGAETPRGTAGKTALSLDPEGERNTETHFRQPGERQADRQTEHNAAYPINRRWKYGGREPTRAYIRGHTYTRAHMLTYMHAHHPFFRYYLSTVTFGQLKYVSPCIMHKAIMHSIKVNNYVSSEAADLQPLKRSISQKTVSR